MNGPYEKQSMKFNTFVFSSSFLGSKFREILNNFCILVQVYNMQAQEAQFWSLSISGRQQFHISCSCAAVKVMKIHVHKCSKPLSRHLPRLAFVFFSKHYPIYKSNSDGFYFLDRDLFSFLI